MTFSERVLDIARSYIGQTEIGDNAGWKDKVFETAMRAIGWMRGWAWCASFVRLVYLQAAEETWGRDSVRYKEIKKALSHGVLKTYQLGQASPSFIIKHNPTPGGIILFDYGKGKGHTGIYVSPGAGTTDILIEGNTNKAGSREGKYVLEKSRVLSKTGLKYLGCMVYQG